MRIPSPSPSIRPRANGPRRANFIAAFTLAGSLAACMSSDPSSPTVPGSLAKVSGDSQTVVHGAALARPMVVRVLAQDGTPLSGITVYWAVATGDSGKLADTTSTSNASGEASMAFTSGPVADSVQISAILNSFSVIGFTQIVTASQATAITPFAGNGAVGVAGAVVQLAVKVTDSAGNPISGVTVTFSTGPHGGTLSTTSATTAATGVARTALTLSAAAGEYTVVASSPGLPSFTLTITQI